MLRELYNTDVYNKIKGAKMLPLLLCPLRTVIIRGYTSNLLTPYVL